MKVASLLFLSICVLCTAANPQFNRLVSQRKTTDLNTRIIGGKDAEEGQFPYQASLRSKLFGHICGASILNNRFLLTAAHCTLRLNSDKRFVYALVGITDLSDHGLYVEFDKIIPHKDFFVSLTDIKNDISLLRSESEIIFTDLIQPIALPTRNTEKYTAVILSGWGYTSNFDQYLSDGLQFVEQGTLNNENCIEQIKEFLGDSENIPVYDSNICTSSSKDVGVCNGDSGGPLVDPENKSLIGIASFIPRNKIKECASGLPDLYTRVYSYLDWIESNIAKQS